VIAVASCRFGIPLWEAPVAVQEAVLDIFAEQIEGSEADPPPREQALLAEVRRRFG